MRIFHRQPRSSGDATERLVVVDSLEGVVQLARDTHLRVVANRSRFHKRLRIGKIQFTIACPNADVGGEEDERRK